MAEASAASPASDSGTPTADGKRDLSPRYQPMVIVLAAVCLGIVVDRFWPCSVFFWWTVAGLGWGVWLGCWRKDWERLAAAMLLVSVAATAASWHHCRWSLFAEDDLGHFARAEDGPVCVEAVALQSARAMPPVGNDPLRPIPTGDRVAFDIELLGIRDGSDWRAASGETRLLVDGRLPQVQPGDRLHVFGQLVEPAEAQNPGGFDYAAYLRTDRRRSVIRAGYAECVSVVGPGRDWGPARLIEQARSHGDRILQQYLDPRQAALAASVLLGARERLDPDRKQAFMETGTVHLLAISGFHVGILAWTLVFLALRLPLPRGPALACVAATMVFYMFVTDARPPVVRATIMVLMMCWAAYLNRRPLSFNTLAVAAVVVLIWNPTELFSAGFQLSFLAVAALAWVTPIWMETTLTEDALDRLIRESRGWFSQAAGSVGSYLYRLFLAGLIIWLITAPLAMARFHLLAPVGVPLSALLWGPMALALVGGFATLVLGCLLPPLAHVSGQVCDQSLWLLQWAVDRAGELPGSHFWVPGPADWWLAGFYGGVGLLVAFPRIRPPRRWCLALVAGWATVGFAVAGLRHDEEQLDCTFLSVGHGCAIVVELPGGQTLLCDAGQLGSPYSVSRSVAEFLWSRGITHLDAVVLSHGDLDHYNALPGLVERFSVGVVYVSPMMFDHPNRATDALQAAIQSQNIPLREIHSGSRLGDLGDCKIEVLHPPERGVLGGDNANSVVLEIDYLGHRILLPSDLEAAGLRDVMAEEPTDYDVLMAPHHGSANSNPAGLAGWSTPEWVVVSGGRRWDIQTIETAYAASGSRVLHTAETGAVTVSIDPSGIKIGRFLPVLSPSSQ
ncbi:MAG TPA: ComEC/Rec2 family competence protein [Thermoguttaceae bacterium]|nr:ComEC/Rec2 family competence protein [Thermoguttaceae bacterium]